jgi:SAM-dependent methyltransferase
MHKRLVEHYDTKYSDEAAPRPVDIVDSPRDRFQMLVKVASEGARGRYLEIGAGNGATVISLANLYDDIAVTELSQTRAQSLSRSLGAYSNVRVLCHDLESQPLPFPDDHFDTVAMCAVIEHLVDPISALVEVRRVMRPGGRLLLDTPNIAKWTRRVKLALGYFPATASTDEGLVTYDGKTPTDLHDEGHLHYFTFRSLERICIDRARFSRVIRRGYGRNPLSQRWATMFSEIFLVAEK